MTDATPIYQSVILERSRKPQFRRRLAGHFITGACRNPLCGDDVAVELRISDAGVIDEAGYAAEGCAILLASADLMTESVQGLAAEQARALAASFEAMLEGGPTVAHQSLACFAPLREYQGRRGCATLPWSALATALSGERA